MSKFLKLILAFILFFSPVLAFATAPDHVHTSTSLVVGERRMYLHSVSWEADDTSAAIADITIPAADLKKYKGAYLYRVITDPGTTSPTDDYDIVINDAYGFDVMEGALADRDETNTEEVECLVPIYGQLTVVFTNNSVQSATGTLVLLIVW